MRKMAGAALIVTLLTLVGQVVTFATQIVMAALYGAGAGMDAFLAASAIPQYTIAVFIGSLGIVFMPVFIDYLKLGRRDDAWIIASSIINFTLLGLGILVAVGVSFPAQILNITAPGLSPSALAQAIQIARILWPSILAASLIALLTGIYQSQSRFGWPAAVPIIGAVVILCLMLALTPSLEIVALAAATTIGTILQAILLLPLLLKHGSFRLTLRWNHPGVLQVFWLLLPIVLVNVVAKSTPLVERFFASKLPVGSISHLGYAFRIFSVLSLLMSTGIATVIFPRMAFNAAGVGLHDLRRIISTGLRVMWMAIAPAMTIGIALAFPLIMVLFQRGQFGVADVIPVAGLLQIYLLALPPACLGSVTGRTFYVLKDTRTLAIFGIVESVAYVFYTSLLSQKFGVSGVAVGYVIFMNISLVWQALVVRHKSGDRGGRTVLNSFFRTGLAAFLAGVATWGITMLTTDRWQQLIFGALSGISVYCIGLLLLQPIEIYRVWNSIRP
jgi:putative peptidoglycan lipid II flippase